MKRPLTADEAKQILASSKRHEIPIPNIPQAKELKWTNESDEIALGVFNVHGDNCRIDIFETPKYDHTVFTQDDARRLVA